MYTNKMSKYLVRIFIFSLLLLFVPLLAPPTAQAFFPGALPGAVSAQSSINWEDYNNYHHHCALCTPKAIPQDCERGCRCPCQYCMAYQAVLRVCRCAGCTSLYCTCDCVSGTICTCEDCGGRQILCPCGCGSANAACNQPGGCGKPNCTCATCLCPCGCGSVNAACNLPGGCGKPSCTCATCLCPCGCGSANAACNLPGGCGKPSCTCSNCLIAPPPPPPEERPALSLPLDRDRPVEPPVEPAAPAVVPELAAPSAPPVTQPAVLPMIPETVAQIPEPEPVPEPEPEPVPPVEVPSKQYIYKVLVSPTAPLKETFGDLDASSDTEALPIGQGGEAIPVSAPPQDAPPTANEAAPNKSGLPPMPLIAGGGLVAALGVPGAGWLRWRLALRKMAEEE